MVDQVVQKFKSEESFSLVLSPEGTRKKVERLRTGFYNIAHLAGVPLVMVGFDFGKKEVVIAEPFTTSEQAADFRLILNFFGQMQGKIPEKGLAHLMNAQNR
jgi:hypothetical protein